ncbi:DUF2798 domain-containing protein [Cupriavidus oxalaticus]|uniref:DUF2798 domain-containing protein n=1 Tax=Cupriavidus oxalaticus TaxID=96344 RepID=A0A4P7LS28_9BURK|nr:DUF2798 domain-containing protein [Cupriavidus oxalaticus]QBY56483.1 DUF2798 domain-containing protein [Cupriavidus oxalaticus]
MSGIPRRYGHLVFGAIQSAISCAITAAIANEPFLASGTFISHWLNAYVVSWALILPIVLLVAPSIRRAVNVLTR